MANRVVKDFKLVTKASPTPNQTMEEAALFDADGAPVTVLTGSNVMSNLPVFAGADVTALKVELNAWRTEMISAGLMAAS